MLENNKDLDHVPDLFWHVNFSVLVHHLCHCHLSSGNENIRLIFHHKLRLLFLVWKVIILCFWNFAVFFLLNSSPKPSLSCSKSSFPCNERKKMRDNYHMSLPN